jgi:hypothetical protein
MEKHLHRSISTQRFIIASLYLLFIGTLILFAFKSFNKDAEGDEDFYVSQAQNLQSNGFSKSIIEGNPVGFSYPVILLSRILGGTLLTSGRLLSFLSIVPLLFGQSYLSKKIFHLNDWSRHIITIFSLQVLIGSGLIFRGITDLYFSAFMIWGLIFLCKMTCKWNSSRNSILTGMLLSGTLLIRPLTLLYLPGILLTLIITFIHFSDPTQRRKYLRSCFIMTCTFIGVFCLVQSPSLIEKRSFSFEDKNPSSSLTWIQLQTLSQLRYDEGTLPEGQHVEWEELKTYLDEHGENSLPKGFFERAKWNPLLVTREFVKDLSISSNYIFLRRTGLLYLSPLLFLFLIRKFRVIKKRILFFLIIGFSYVVVLNSITLTNVEWRWLILPLLLSITIGTASLQFLGVYKPQFVRMAYIVQFVFLLTSLTLDLKNLASGRLE